MGGGESMSITISNFENGAQTTTTHKAEWIEKTLRRKAEIINGDASGRLQGTKAMFLDYVGTFYNYTGDLRREKDCTDAEWEALFKVLTNPINDHIITVPYGGTTLTSRFYISSVESGLITKKGGSNEWEKIYKVTFTSMSPQRVASNPDTIIGVN
jgi:hypothetical protein